MIKREVELEAEFRNAAQEAIPRYARGILSVDVLVELIRREWERHQKQGAHPTLELWRRLAQRCCSHALCLAWQSSDPELRDFASANLRRYLKKCLQRTQFAAALHYCEYALDDIVHETLEELQRAYVKGKNAVPNDPAAFLKWSQTILVRKAGAFIEKMQRGAPVSLDAHKEQFMEDEQMVDRRNGDPQEITLGRELQQALKDAILSLRNSHYRVVVWYTFIVGLDEQELARRLGVTVQQIYLWRHRALKVLRDNPELIRLFHLRE